MIDRDPSHETRRLPLPGIASLWLGLVLLLILSIAALLPVLPNDYWWYLRVGRDIVATGVIPTVDAYSWTRLGEPFHYPAWLSAVILHGLYAAGGIPLTVLARMVIAGITFTMLWFVCRKTGAGPRLSALVVLAIAAAASNNLAIRPQLLAYPLLPLTLLVLQAWQKGHTRWLLALPVIGAVWSNLHGSFLLSLIVPAAALVGGGGSRRWLAGALVATLAAQLVNPRGLEVWQYVTDLLSSPPVRHLATEWQSPTPDVWQNAVFFAWLVGLPLIASLSSYKPTPTHWAWFLIAAALALNSIRFVAWSVMLFAPITAALLAPLVDPLLERGSGRGIPALTTAILAFMLVAPLALLPGVRERWWQQSPPALDPTTGMEAITWLADHPELPGPLWNDIAFGSTLIYVLPERPVAIDTRFELYPLDQWQSYMAISAARWDWEELLAADGVNLLLVSVDSQPELIRAARRSAGWREVYADDYAVIFARVESISSPP